MPTNTLTKSIQMVDLKGQHQRITQEINEAVQEVIESAAFINGPAVKDFAQSLAVYMETSFVIPCGNGTDALQIAMMALGLKGGDEVIVPAFTYVATVEVIALLGLKPVFIDIDPKTFNLDVNQIEEKITSKTKAIVPVHLFGQCADMQPILVLAEKNNLFIIEDAAQAIGAKYKYNRGERKIAGTIGHIGTTSFFPSKNLGCFGDGGAIFTDDETLANKIKVIGNHGQVEKYHFERVGVNSRLDTIQAAILNVKLKYLDEYTEKRARAAKMYDELLEDVPGIILPYRDPRSTHVFNQYSIKVKNNKRDQLRTFLKENGVPSMVYYPKPLHLQNAYATYGYKKGDLPVSETLSEEIMSLPMHPELEKDHIEFVVSQIKDFLHAK